MLRRFVLCSYIEVFLKKFEYGFEYKPEKRYNINY